MDDTGLFRWVDGEGKIMVESIWWRDGLLDQFKPSFEEVGEGWLILASDDAMNSIKSQYKQLKRRVNIERYIPDGTSRVNSKFTEEYV